MIFFNMALAGCIIFVAYLLFIVVRFGIPESLSQSFYLLGKARVVFPIVMYSCALLLVYPMMTVIDESWQFLAFLSCAGIMFVGAAPYFLEDGEKIIHTASAYVAAACGLLWTAIAYDWQNIVVCAMICAFFAWMTSSYKKSLTWWLEMVAFLSVFSTLFTLL